MQLLAVQTIKFILSAVTRMNDKQYKKTKRLFIIAIVLICIVISLLFLFITKPKDVVNNYYKGENGLDGKTPIKGVDYADGKNGLNAVSTNTIVQNNTTEVVKTIETQKVIEQVPIKGDSGEKGDKGDAGVSEKQLIKVDYETCKLKTKYESDDTWQTIAQLPKPCGVENAK